MNTARWRTGVAIWGLMVLVYCVTIWPRHFPSSPFSSDESHLAARVGVMVRFVAFWLVPVGLVWIGRKEHRGLVDKRKADQ